MSLCKKRNTSGFAGHSNDATCASTTMWTSIVVETDGQFWPTVFDRVGFYLSKGISHQEAPHATIVDVPTQAIWEAIKRCGRVTPELLSQCTVNGANGQYFAVCTSTRPYESVFLNGLTDQGAHGVAAIVDAMARLRVKQRCHGFAYEDHVVWKLSQDEFKTCQEVLANHVHSPQVIEFLREQDIAQTPACTFFGGWDFKLYGDVLDDVVPKCLLLDDEDETKFSYVRL